MSIAVIGVFLCSLLSTRISHWEYYVEKEIFFFKKDEVGWGFLVAGGDFFFPFAFVPPQNRRSTGVRCILFSMKSYVQEAQIRSVTLLFQCVSNRPYKVH